VGATPAWRQEPIDIEAPSDARLACFMFHVVFHVCGVFVCSSVSLFYCYLARVCCEARRERVLRSTSCKLYLYLPERQPLPPLILYSSASAFSHQSSYNYSHIHIHRSGPAGARQTLARPGPRQTSTQPLMLTSARPPTRAWEVARTVVAPPLSVVKSACGCGRWRCSFGGLVVRVCVPVSGVFSLLVCPVCV